MRWAAQNTCALCCCDIMATHAWRWRLTMPAQRRSIDITVSHLIPKPSHMWPKFCGSMSAFRRRRQPDNGSRSRRIAPIASPLFLVCFLASAQTVTLPEGKGKPVFQKMCSQCHGLDVALAQPQTRDHWRSVVQDMVARGARGTDAEIDEVVDYLATHYGKQGTETPASTAAESGPSEVEHAAW